MPISRSVAPTAAGTPLAPGVGDLHAPGAVLLVACYELGHQPLSLAAPLALLRSAGYDPAAVDTSVQELSDEALRTARLIAIATPMHTALRLGVRVAERARALNDDATICFYGLYATLNADYLLQAHADALIGGEYEQTLLALADALATAGVLAPENTPPGVRTRTTAAQPVLKRLPFVAPARESLPAPRQYAHLARGAAVVPAGYVEASRGCLHTCLHCPITPVYGGRFFVTPRAVVLADIRAQVAQGVGHITFGDPDFLNGPGHSLAIARALHSEFPEVTFDATIKIEHIRERRELIGELGQLGCAFIVSAVESLSADVLRHLAKGHSRADVVEALGILEAAGIPMRPTFVAFTPWTTASDYLDLLAFVAEYDLIEHIDPVQYSIRLLVPPGSALLEAADTPQWLGALEQAAFSYRWAHPDPRMDELQRAVAALVESAARDSLPTADTFAGICNRATKLLGMPLPVAKPRRRKQAQTHASRPIPHLTEAWFC